MRRRAFNRLLGAASFGALTWPGLASAALARGTVSGRVTVNRRKGRKGRLKPKRDHSGVVVYLEGVPESRTTRGNALIEIRQVDQRFTPSMAVALVGTKVSFPNDDKVHHNVYSNSEALEFDLGLYKSGLTKIVTVRQPGRIEVFCNIHHDMRATILVLDTRHHDMTDKSGQFSLRNVPPGTYGYVAWQRDGKAARGKVTVEAGKDTALDIELVEEASPERHVDKHGKPIGPY